MVNIHWNGLYITGSVSHDPGVHTFRNGDPGYPPSTDVEIEAIEFDDDAGEFAEFLERHKKPAEWISLPKEAKDWITTKFDEQISDAIADKFFETNY